MARVTVVEKRKNSVLLIAIEDLYKEQSPFEEDEIFVDCSGMHIWVYEKVAKGQIVEFSFRKDVAREEIVPLLDIYPADARYAEKYYFQDDFAVAYDDFISDFVPLKTNIKRSFVKKEIRNWTKC